MINQETNARLGKLLEKEGFSDKVQACQNKEELRKLLEEYGGTVTLEEFAACVQEAGEELPENLDEDALDQVSGGQLRVVATGPVVRPSAALAAWFARRFW